MEERVARYYVWDFAEKFKAVIDDFVSSYARGETPNPCVRCNQRIKFSALLARASRWASTRWPPATMPGWRVGGCAAPSTWDKDQSYVLAVLTAEQLRHAAFPIGDTPKPQIRAEAAARGLAVADKPDSHDICFIPSGNTRAFLVSASRCAAATVVGADGAVLANHDGVHGFTIGQRKGLGIAGPGPDGRPRYVTAIDADTATVHVGDVADLDVHGLVGREPVFPGSVAPSGPVECSVQVRAHGENVSAVAELVDDELSCGCVLRCAAWRAVRPWCYTVPTPTVTRCSAAPPSPELPASLAIASAERAKRDSAVRTHMRTGGA